eukprot:4033661-Prymnesium_polylepis.1
MLMRSQPGMRRPHAAHLYASWLEECEGASAGGAVAALPEAPTAAQTTSAAADAFGRLMRRHALTAADVARF